MMWMYNWATVTVITLGPETEASSLVTAIIMSQLIVSTLSLYKSNCLH